MTCTGFDLDMTLIDSRPGIKAVYDELAARTGTFIDSDLVVSRLGPPVEAELAHWFPADVVPEMADRYRALYPAIAVDRVTLLPGAREAIEAAAERGRTLLVTAKAQRNAELHVQHLHLPLDAVHGDVWRDGKAGVLREASATLYVGDHVHDMDAARLAAIPGVGVTTGPCSGAELAAAGAALVVDSLTELASRLADSDPALVAGPLTGDTEVTNQ